MTNKSTKEKLEKIEGETVADAIKRGAMKEGDYLADTKKEYSEIGVWSNEIKSKKSIKSNK